MYQVLISMLLFSTMLQASPASKPIPSTKHIPRFRMVAEGFYRGGQPEGLAGFQFLKQQGFKTIINLRQENDEASVVKRLGMNYVHLPMSVSPWSKIPQSSIAKYFQVMSNPDNYPIFIHCRRGADRTGAMVGFYRIAAQGWNGKRAHSEARDIGMRWWYPGLKKQLYDFKPPKEARNLQILPAAIVRP
jgi:protein tyrosine/serine phosphatase